jgi:predicted flap endonuclease-1-like 5' DNA nuclease
MLTPPGEIAGLVLAVLIGICIGWAVWGRGTSGSRATRRPRHAAPRRSVVPTTYGTDLSTGDVRVLPRNGREGKRREPAHANARRTDRPGSPEPAETIGTTDTSDMFEPAAPAGAATGAEGANDATHTDAPDQAGSEAVAESVGARRAPSDVDGAGEAAASARSGGPAVDGRADGDAAAQAADAPVVAPSGIAGLAVPDPLTRPVSTRAVPPDVEAGSDGGSDSSPGGPTFRAGAVEFAGADGPAPSVVDGAGRAVPERPSTAEAAAGPATTDSDASVVPGDVVDQAAAANRDPAVNGATESDAVRADGDAPESPGAGDPDVPADQRASAASDPAFSGAEIRPPVGDDAVEHAVPNVGAPNEADAHGAALTVAPSPAADASGVGGNGARAAAVASENGAVRAGPAGQAAQSADDLQQVVGIGPVIQQVLVGVGITTYRQLVELVDDDEALARTGTALGGDLRARIERQRWVEQARELHFRKYGERL